LWICFGKKIQKCLIGIDWEVFVHKSRKLLNNSSK
jgi:hypothetical protein